MFISITILEGNFSISSKFEDMHILQFTSDTFRNLSLITVPHIQECSWPTLFVKAKANKLTKLRNNLSICY